MLENTILLPSAWKGGDLHEEDWIIDLPDPLVEELTNAAKLLHGRGLSFKQANAGDYRLESWQSVLNEIRERIEGGLGFTLLRGLPAENGLDLARLYLWGLGCHLGFPEPQDAVGNLMHDVKDTGNTLSNPDIRLYQTNLALSYHNDGADAFILMCCHAAQRGGETKLVSALSVFNTILECRPDLACVLQQPFYFDARGQQRPNSPLFQRVPVFVYHKGYLNVLYKREYIESAQRFPEVPELTPQQIEAMDMMDRLCDELALGFVMKPGDLIIANNYELLHARSAFQNGGMIKEGRHMLRLWISLPNARPLPAVFGDTREFCHSYARRCEPVVSLPLRV